MGSLMYGETKGKVTKPLRVNNDGSLSLQDIGGNQSFNGVFGDQFVAHRTPSISANFNYNLDSRAYNVTETNSATVVKEASLLVLKSGTNANGEAILQTSKSVRYRAGRDIEFMATVRFDAGVADNHRRYGLYAPDNGVYIGYEGLEFGVSIRKAGNTEFITQDNWNMDKCDGKGPSGFNWDFSKMNIVRIAFGYLGIAPILFQVYGGVNYGWITCHAYDVVNKMDTSHIDMPYLPIRASNKNDGNTTNVSIYSASVYCGTIDGGGTFDSSSREFSQKVSFVNVTSGTDKPLIVFNNQELYQGVSNRIDDQLLRVALATEGTKTVNISLYKLAVDPTGGTWSDVSTLDSNMRINTTATIDLTGAELLMSWGLGKADSIQDNVKDLGLLLSPDQYAVFTYTSTGASDVEFSNRWSELF